MDKKKKKKGGQALFTVLCLGLGGVCGALLPGLYYDRLFQEDTFGHYLLFVAILLLGLWAGLLVNIVLHEAGHLVAGLLSGYRFSSFRIGSLMLIREGDKLRLRHYSLAGTAGQCIMAPPELVDGKCPVVLYNLGGVLMNFLVGALCLIIVAWFPIPPAAGLLLMLLGITGVGCGLMNGVPMNTGMVKNDGGNVVELVRNPAAVRAFWVQLKVTEQLSKGVSLTEMDESWFALPPREQMGSCLIATLAVFRENWLMEKHQFEDAEALIDDLLAGDYGLAGLHRQLLICDKVFLLLLRGESAQALMDEPQQKFMKAMKTHPSVLRTQYAWACLGEKNREKAAEAEKAFAQVAARYPYPVEIETEKALMELVKSKEF